VLENRTPSPQNSSIFLGQYKFIIGVFGFAKIDDAIVSIYNQVNLNTR